LVVSVVTDIWNDGRRRKVLAGEVSWCRWSYNREYFSLDHQNDYSYELTRLDEPKDYVSLINHVASNERFTSQDVGDFVRAIDEIANLSGNLVWIPPFRVLPATTLELPLPDPIPLADVHGSGVYAVRAADKVKIGRAVDIRKRISGMQVGNHEPMELLAVLSECTDDEAKWHNRFAHLRLDRGEWFHLGEQIAVFIRFSRWMRESCG
jgi:Meiotically up-regulated gene 113